jgi:hypothetical protein
MSASVPARHRVAVRRKIASGVVLTLLMLGTFLAVALLVTILGATAFSGLTGARGEGVKVAVVDDGVDHEHPFLSPTGFSYPAGFPKGNTGSTTPKVIAARGLA